MTTHPEPRSPDEPLSADEEAKFRESVSLAASGLSDIGVDDADYDWWSVQTAMRLLATLDHLRAAARQPDRGRFRDAAWMEAEEALPEGSKQMLYLHRRPGNYVAGLRHPDPTQTANDVSREGPTPAAALLSLAEALRGR